MAFKIYLESIYSVQSEMCSSAAIHFDELQRSDIELQHPVEYPQIGPVPLELPILGNHLVDVRLKSDLIKSAFDMFEDGRWDFSEAAVKLPFEHLQTTSA